MSEWKWYYKPGATEMTPWTSDDDLEGVSVSPEDTPGPGGMIARNADNHKDKWYVAKAFFEKNYRPVD